MTAIFKITPTVQTYDWGKVGKDSIVAQLAVASKLSGFSLEDKTPYAELWMGTHPKSPSRLASSGQPLSEYLAAHPELMGGKVTKDFDASDGNLPFLFKVLSIAKALSIQTHPDKQTAEELHHEQPEIYKDPNHKPEMALALTPFEALCGFLPLPRIATYLSVTPEFAALIPPAIARAFIALSTSPTPTGPQEKAALKDVFGALMTAPAEQISENLGRLVRRFREGEGAVHVDERGVRGLVLKLDEQFPGDIGIFCAFVLNYVTLQPGEALYLGAGEPHAYVAGDIMECMANSDNVIRAGLTPKLRDIPNLVAGLTYSAGEPIHQRVTPAPFARSDPPSASTLYDPPIPEFSVLRVEGAARHEALEGPSIFAVTEGVGSLVRGAESLEVGRGDVVFVGAATPLEVRPGSAGFTGYRAFVEVNE